MVWCYGVKYAPGSNEQRDSHVERDDGREERNETTHAP
jgi:hypothetical protein